MNEKYKSILHMERPRDTKHPPMSLHNRAAQFAPFDALTGFGGRIHEVSRVVDQRPEITDEVKQHIDTQLRLLAQRIQAQPLITVTYFLPDRTKDGGSCQTITASAEKLDSFNETLILEEEIRIKFDDILELQIDSAATPSG